MSTPSQATANLQRLREAGVKAADLQWFLSMAPESALETLPADALFFPGQQTRDGDTLVDLRTGRPIYLRETVPVGTVYCLLGPLKPHMRTEANRS